MIERMDTKITYAGTGSTGPFSFPFRVPDAMDLKLIQGDEAGGEELLHSDEYSLALEDDGGAVTLSEVLPDGNTLTIKRDTDALPASSFSEFNSYQALALDREFDRVYMIMQQLLEKTSRAPLLRETTDIESLTLPTGAPASLIGWDLAVRQLRCYSPGAVVTVPNIDTIANYDSLADAVEQIGNSNAFLYIDRAITVEEDLFVPENLCIFLASGGFISVQAGHTLTLRNYLIAGSSRVFGGTGTVILDGAQPGLVEWFGDTLDFDAAPAFNKALVALSSISLLAGREYSIRSQVIIPKSRMKISGWGSSLVGHQNLQDFMFLQPKGDSTKAFIEFEGLNVELGGSLGFFKTIGSHMITLRKVRIWNAAATPNVVAIEFRNTFHINLRDCHIHMGRAEGSVGARIANLEADGPFQIFDNGLIENSHFQRCETALELTFERAANTVNLKNVSFNEDMVGLPEGCRCIALTGICDTLSIEGCKTESYASFLVASGARYKVLVKGSRFANVGGVFELYGPRGYLSLEKTDFANTEENTTKKIFAYNDADVDLLDYWYKLGRDITGYQVWSGDGYGSIANHLPHQVNEDTESAHNVSYNFDNYSCTNYGATSRVTWRLPKIKNLRIMRVRFIRISPAKVSIMPDDTDWIQWNDNTMELGDGLSTVAPTEDDAGNRPDFIELHSYYQEDSESNFWLPVSHNGKEFWTRYEGAGGEIPEVPINDDIMLKSTYDPGRDGLVDTAQILMSPGQNRESVATIKKGMPIAIHESGLGFVRACAADNTKHAIGLASADIVPWAEGRLQFTGAIFRSDWSEITEDASALLTPLAIYYLSTTTGKITATPPDDDDQVLQPLLKALSTTTASIQIGEATLL